MDFFTTLVKDHAIAQDLAEHSGRVYGFQFGLVVDRDDPMGMGRVRALVANKGDQNRSDWLTRATIGPLASLPVPAVGDLVIIGYEVGDPHKGCYLATVQNVTNPAADKDSLRLQVGQAVLAIAPDGSVTLAAPSVTISAPTVAFTGASSVSINGQQVATVGALDTRNDTLVNRGW